MKLALLVGIPGLCILILAIAIKIWILIWLGTTIIKPISNNCDKHYGTEKIFIKGDLFCPETNK